VRFIIPFIITTGSAFLRLKGNSIYSGIIPIGDADADAEAEPDALEAADSLTSAIDGKASLRRVTRLCRRLLFLVNLEEPGISIYCKD